MSYKWTNDGRDFFEQAVVTNGTTPVINTILVGNGDSSPNNADTSLDNELYQNDTSSPNITITRGSGTGEIRATIELTGGTEVPSNSELIEFGFETDSSDFVYREVRGSPIDVAAGETVVVEIRAFIEDADTESEQVITDVGREFVADAVIGNTTDGLQYIAVGKGTGTVSQSDTTLNNELYRGDKANSNVEISTTSNVGDVNAEITVTAGTDPSDNVDPNSEISEFGLLTGNAVLLLHEKRAAVTLENNDTKTFDIPLTIIQ